MLINPVARAQPVTAGARPIGRMMIGKMAARGAAMVEIRRATGFLLSGLGAAVLTRAGAFRGREGITDQIKCCRWICRHTTDNALANGWAYCDKAPRDLSRWIGKWTCPLCVEELRQSLAALGAEPERGITAQQLNLAVSAWGRFRSAGRERW